jgi:urease subunit alpha
VAQMGDPNGSIPVQPMYSRPMFGALGRAVERSAVVFVSKAAQEDDLRSRLGIAKATVAVENTRDIAKRDMIHNSATPKVEIHPETYEVRADGEVITCAPATELPLAQRYFLF